MTSYDRPLVLENPGIVNNLALHFAVMGDGPLKVEFER